MQRFWSYLAVQLGKHAIWVSVIGLLITVGLGFGITKLEFATGQDSYLNKSDQVSKDNVVYQRPLRRPGDAHRDLDGAGPHGRRAVHRRRAPHSSSSSTTRCGAAARSTASSRRSSILEFSDALVSSPDGNPTSRASPARRCWPRRRRRRPGSPAADGTRQGLRRHDRAAERGAAGRAHARQPRVGEVPALRQPGPGAQGPPLVHPRRRTTRRSIMRLPGQRVDRATRAPRPTRRRRSRSEAARSPNTATVTTGAAVLLKDINDYLRGGMLTLGGIAVADHGRDPAGVLPGAVATAAAARRARRRRVGVRSRRLPRHPAHDRHDRRPPRDARHRHRLRDPDARARRGGGASSTAPTTRSRRRRATSGRRCSS